jgi:putative intracellular protease/amidase
MPKARLSLLFAALALSALPASGAKTRNVAVVLYEGVEVLDFAGPAEVFQQAGGYSADRGVSGYHVYTVAPTKASITSQGFVKVEPQYSVADAPKPDILVIPGGSTGSLLGNPEFMAWAAKAIPESEVTLTVCTGAFVASKLGALDGKTVTTWYGAVERLRKKTPKATVQEGRRFVDNGRIVTTAGVSAGIDGALHVVARLSGRAVADRTARYMEYHWFPESWAASSYAYLNPGLDDAGRERQQANLFGEQSRWSDAAAAWKGIVERNPQDGYAWSRTGVALHNLAKYEDAIAAFRKAAEFPEQRADALFSIACGESLRGRKEEALRALGDAVDSGFRAKWALEGDADLDAIRSDPRFAVIAARVK